MNYELAKKLKEAGFPQLMSGKGDFINEEGDGFEEMQRKGFASLTKYLWYCPTLEELIEASSPHLEELMKVSSYWVAISIGTDPNPLGPIMKAKGSTPSEAVANLWLELNKKAVQNQ